MLDVDRHEEPLPGLDLMVDAVEPGSHAAADDVDELLRIRVIVLRDPVACGDGRDPHEAGRRADALRAEQRSQLPPPPGIRGHLLDRSHVWLLTRFHLVPPRLRGAVLPDVPATATQRPTVTKEN